MQHTFKKLTNKTRKTIKMYVQKFGSKYFLKFMVITLSKFLEDETEVCNESVS